MSNNVTAEPNEVFAVDFAQLAREIAMDIFELPQILELHRMSDEEWTKISQHPKFISMVADISREWNSATNTAERVKIKAATGLEAMLETYVRDLNDLTIPLVQRVEAGKFLAKLGELGERAMGASGGAFHITLNIGQTTPLYREVKLGPTVIDATVIPEVEE